jgi:hypothetical protein
MSRKDELIALAERVEALTGPDREINKALVPLVGLRLVEEGHPFGLCCYDANGHGVPLPNFTASLDAAMSLVPEGWVSVRGWDYRNRASRAIFIDDEGVRLFWGRAATPALAMTAAALRAIAETQEQQP